MNFITPYVARRVNFLSQQSKMLTGSQGIRTLYTKNPHTASARLVYSRPAFYCLSGAAMIGGGLCFNQAYHSEASSTEKRQHAFNRFGFISLKLREVQDINHNVKKFRFDLPDQDQVTGLTVSSFVLTRIAKSGTENNWWPSYVFRPYTPVSKEQDVGYIDLIVKRYDQGAGASSAIHQLQPGDTLQFFGKPISACKYEPNQVKSISMIAAGSGITPMIQLLRKIMENPEDQTRVHLLYCNRTEQDILFRDQLTQLEATHGHQFKVTYCLSRPQDNDAWNGETGRITLDMMKKYLPEPNSSTRVYICGPDGFTGLIKGEKKFFGRGKKGLLEQLGYQNGQVQVF